MVLNKVQTKKIAKYLWMRGVSNVLKDMEKNLWDLTFDIEYTCMKQQFGNITKDNILECLELAKTM